MVYITEEATSVLDEIRTQALEQMEDLPEGIAEPGLRLLIQDEQVSMALDVPHAADQIIRRNGHPVLLLDPNVVELIDGATVDVQHGPEGDRLVIEHRDEGDEQRRAS